VLIRDDLTKGAAAHAADDGCCVRGGDLRRDAAGNTHPSTYSRHQQRPDELGRGEKVGSIDLPPDEELEGVGESFRAISEKLAARSLGRLMAGVTTRCRNPLNAMAIHLELVREHLLRLQRNSRAPVGAVLGLDGREEPIPDVTGAREHPRRDWLGDQAARRGHYRVRALHPPGGAPARPVDVQLLIAEVVALVEPDAAATASPAVRTCPTTCPSYAPTRPCSGRRC
jgi:hypothetical protein